MNCCFLLHQKEKKRKKEKVKERKNTEITNGSMNNLCIAIGCCNSFGFLHNHHHIHWILYTHFAENQDIFFPFSLHFDYIKKIQIVIAIIAFNYNPAERTV